MMTYLLTLVFIDGNEISFEIVADNPYFAVCDLFNNTNITIGSVRDIVCLLNEED